MDEDADTLFTTQTDDKSTHSLLTHCTEYEDTLSRVSSTSTFCEKPLRRLKTLDGESLYDFHAPVPTPPSLKHLPLCELAAQGTIGRLRIRYRLWRYATYVQNGCPQLHCSHIRDLIELHISQGPNTRGIRDEAWNLLVKLLRMGRSYQVAEAVLSDAQSLLPEFLASILQHNLSGQSPIPEVCHLIFSLQESRLHRLQDVMSLDRFCVLTTPELRAFPACPIDSWLMQFAETKAIEAANMGALNWTISVRGSCLVNFLLGEDTPKGYIHDVVKRICSYLEASCATPDMSHHLKGCQLLMRTQIMHPMLPFLQLAIHLSLKSAIASKSFIDAGLLNIIGRSWVQGFPDAREGTAMSQAKMQNDMRVACLMVVAALSLRFPASQGMSDHLLKHYTSPDNQGCCPHDGTFEPRDEQDACIHIPSISEFIRDGFGTEESYIRSAYLLMIEGCVARRVHICHEVPSSKIGPWDHVVSVLSSPRLMKGASFSDRDRASRIILSCAAAPEHYWRPLLDTLYKRNHDEIFNAFSYLLRDYLQVPKDSAKPFHDPGIEVDTFLMKFTEVNPIDRFILLMRQAAESRPVSLGIRDAGMADLIRGLHEGLFDPYNVGTGNLTGSQRESRLYACKQLQIIQDRDYETEISKRNCAPKPRGLYYETKAPCRK